ncbi:hypothetical protein [Acerihabitans arboris]|nr:hypothetical protein [Acerihabitans arboris]
MAKLRRALNAFSVLIPTGLPGAGMLTERVHEKHPYGKPGVQA